MQIIPYLSEIGQIISQNVVTIVSAPTGSGKSIGIPSSFGQSGVRIFISIPTITAARSLANYQKMVTPNVSVGFAAEGDIEYNQETRIIYATSGHLRRKLLTYFSSGEAKDVDFTDILMIDEAHTGSLDNSVNIDLWKYAAKSGVSVPRLVLSSATIELPSEKELPEKEKNSLTQLFAGILEPATIKINLPRRSLSIEYHQNTFDPDEMEIYSATAQIAIRFHHSTTPGDMLIFAPGSSEVENLVKLLEQAKLEKALILPAYGAMSSDELSAIYQQASGVRKIIIATNVAESAITISNLGIVIDTMLEKRIELSKSGGTRLVLTYISQSSADQRAGRTGRTRDGVCYRMMTEGKYQTLEKQRPPEITRVPLYNVIMEIMNAGIRPIDLLTHVSGQQILDAIELLIYLQLVDKRNRTPTEAGRFVTSFPLSVQNATVLWRWKEKDLPMFPAIVVMSLIDSYGPSYMYYPRREPDQTNSDYRSFIERHTKQYFDRFIGYSDLDTLINIWTDLMESIDGPYGKSDKVVKWSRDNSMNNKKIREVLNIIHQSLHQCQRRKLKCHVGPFTREGTLDELRPILADVYANMTMSLFKQGDKIAYLHGGVGGYAGTPAHATEYKLDSRVVMNNFFLNPPPFLVGLSSAELVGKNMPIRLLTLSIDVQPIGFPQPRTTHPSRLPRRAQLKESPEKKEKISSALALLKTLKK